MCYSAVVRAMERIVAFTLSGKLLQSLQQRNDRT